MCYPCTLCGRCGKFKKDSPFYRPPAHVVCFECGGNVDLETGICENCGARAFEPAGPRGARREDQESKGEQ